MGKYFENPKVSLKNFNLSGCENAFDEIGINKFSEMIKKVSLEYLNLAGILGISTNSMIGALDRLKLIKTLNYLDISYFFSNLENDEIASLNDKIKSVVQMLPNLQYLCLRQWVFDLKRLKLFWHQLDNKTFKEIYLSGCQYYPETNEDNILKEFRNEECKFKINLEN